MKSIYIDFNPARLAATYLAGRIRPSLYLGPTSPLHYGDVAEPRLPGPRWVRVKSILSGICGSDIAAITMKGSTALLPITPQRIYLGHEAVGEVVEVGSAVGKVKVGDRIILDGMFSCRERGFDPPCRMCARGLNTICEKVAEPGHFKGLGVGFADTVGGGWSEHFVCGEDQCVPLPDGFSWEEGLMCEMLAVAVRSILYHPPKKGEQALVIGAGPIGLSVLQALKALFPGVHVSIAARYPHQQEAARRLGADEVIGGSLYDAAHRIAGAQTHKVPFSKKPTVIGGFENIYDSVGSADSLDDAVRLARAGGRVAILGAAYEAKIDWTFVWFKELTVYGTLAYSTEKVRGGKKRTFEIAADLMRQGKVNHERLVTHKFPLKHYKQAILTLMDKKSGQNPIKVALMPNE